MGKGPCQFNWPRHREVETLGDMKNALTLFIVHEDFLTLWNVNAKKRGEVNLTGTLARAEGGAPPGDGSQGVESEDDGERERERNYEGPKKEDVWTSS